MLTCTGNLLCKAFQSDWFPFVPLMSDATYYVDVCLFLNWGVWGSKWRLKLRGGIDPFKLVHRRKGIGDGLRVNESKSAALLTSLDGFDASLIGYFIASRLNEHMLLQRNSNHWMHQAFFQTCVFLSWPDLDIKKWCRCCRVPLQTLARTLLRQYKVRDVTWVCYLVSYLVQDFLVAASILEAL